MRLTWAGAEFHHEEAAAQELSGTILHCLEWRDELVGVRRGEDTKTGVRHWEEDMLVCSARRKILSYACIWEWWGINFQQSLWNVKEHMCQNKPHLSTHSLKGMAERKTPLSSPGQQLQQSSSEEEEQGRADLQTFTSRTSSLKDQSKYPLKRQESRSVSCTEEVCSEKRTRDPYGK